MATEVIAPEEWALPSRVLPAAHSEDGYRRALRDAERALTDPRTWLFPWGYHPLWHGRLDRGALDELSRAWPIGVWHRSCHEWFLNSAAIEALGITRPGSCISKSSAPKALCSCRHFSSMRAARPMPAWIPPTRWPTPRRRSRACTGKVRLLPKHVKLFADGAIISQRMQMGSHTSTTTADPTHTITANG